MQRLALLQIHRTDRKNVYGKRSPVYYETFHCIMWKWAGAHL